MAVAMLPTHSATFFTRRDFRDAILLHLGRAAVSGTAPCARCGGVMDTQGRHALRCAPGQAPRGHSRERDALHGLASRPDDRAMMEASWPPCVSAASSPS